MDQDWIIIFKMRQGNDAAWEQFVRKYYGDILKYCYFHCQNKENAEDLTQEVFLKFCVALGSYQHRGKAKNYLYTIAANLCKDQVSRKQALPLERVTNVEMDGQTDLDERLTLEMAIRRLPEELGDVILLRYYQGLKLAEIAAVLGIGLPLVKYRLRRGKEELRKELSHGAK